MNTLPIEILAQTYDALAVILLQSVSVRSIRFVVWIPSGLSGWFDIFLHCSSLNSRNSHLTLLFFSRILNLRNLPGRFCHIFLNIAQEPTTDPYTDRETDTKLELAELLEGK